MDAQTTQAGPFNVKAVRLTPSPTMEAITVIRRCSRFRWANVSQPATGTSQHAKLTHSEGAIHNAAACRNISPQSS